MKQEINKCIYLNSSNKKRMSAGGRGEGEGQGGGDIINY